MPRSLVGWLWPSSDDLDLHIDVALLLRHVKELPARFKRLETLIMTTASDLAARLDAATNEIAQDLQAAQAAAIAAVAGKDEAVREAVAQALAPLDAGVARLEALGADPADPVPAPEEIEPAPAEPVDGEPTA